MASSWHHNGITMASQWHRNGITMASQWHHNGITMASQWHRNGITMASQWHALIKEAPVCSHAPSAGEERGEQQQQQKVDEGLAQYHKPNKIAFD
jgi:adenine-specific DNA methylase